MKAKLFLIAAALLVFSAAGFGQGFTSSFIELDEILTVRCAGGPGIPDGVMYTLMQDVDGDGSEFDDPQAQLCDNPPTCEGSICGFLNWNTLAMNGEVMTGVAGQFFPDYAFSSGGCMPTINRFFIKVVYDNPPEANGFWRVMWKSAVVSPAVGPSELEMSGWVCSEEFITTTPTCTQPANAAILPAHQEGNVPQNTEPVCFNLCSDPGVTTLCVGPLVSANRRPHVTITPCAEGGAGAWVLGDWTWDGVYYCASLELAAGAAEGCVCVDLDFIEPANFGSIDVVPLSGAVKINWTTLAETEVARFDIVRDGEVVGSREAVGGTSGAEYSYTDEVANGRIYTYKLIEVSVTGERTEVYSEAVNPSTEHAVITEYALGQNYPNPFNPTTNISFDLVENNPVTLTVYNAAGQLVSTVVSGATMQAGRHIVSFDATNLTSGLYFYTVKIGNEFTATKKMLLVK